MDLEKIMKKRLHLWLQFKSHFLMLSSGTIQMKVISKKPMKKIEQNHIPFPSSEVPRSVRKWVCL